MQINVYKLERERDRLGMNKADFIRFLELKPNVYYYILQNRTTTLKRIAKIAKKLELDSKDLLTN